MKSFDAYLSEIDNSITVLTARVSVGKSYVKEQRRLLYQTEGQRLLVLAMQQEQQQDEARLAAAKAEEDAKTAAESTPSTE